MERLVRFQVAVTKQQFHEFEQLMQSGGLKTNRDLLNNAITLLKWAAREKAKGAAIVSINESEGSCKELQLPFLENVALSMKVGAERTEVDRVPLRAVGKRRSRD